MWFRSLFDFLKRPGPRDAACSRRTAALLRMESLEDRSLLSRYSIVQLPLWSPKDINAHGQVVGYVNGHAALWQDGTVIDLGSLAGPAGYSIAYAINDAGQVVGSSQVPGSHEFGAAFLITPEDIDRDGSPDRWSRDDDQDGVNDLMIALGAFGDVYNIANDINVAGQVVGRSGGRAVLWQNGDMIDLGSGIANGINDAGQVVGTDGRAFLLNPEDTDSDGVPDRWFRDTNNDGANDLMVGISTPEWGGRADAVNATGQVVGMDGYFPFLWTPSQPNGTSGNKVYLPVRGDVNLDINGSAQVVGSVFEGADEYDAYWWAMLWEDGATHYLGDLIPGDSGWNSLEFAHAINDDGWIVGEGGQGGFLMVPSDQGPPTLSISDVTVTEGNVGTRAATFTVTLSAASGLTVTVGYATANGSASAVGDYQAASDTLTFAPGENSKTITVLVNGDHLVEPTEGFVVILSDSTNANIVDAYGQCTILDDEPRISITDAAIAEGNTGTRSATFTVTLSAISEADVTVHYDTADIWDATAGSDFTSASGDVVIPAGQTSATFAVAILGDRLVEANEGFAVNLSGATNAAIADGQGIGTILDDEPRISISDATKREGRKNTTSFTFTVTLSNAYDEPVTVSYRTADGTATTSDGDYVAKAGTITFAPGETTKTITIEVKGDSKKEADETFYLDLFWLSSNALFTRNRCLGTIVNDD